MSESARSIVLNLGTNLHAAFDTSLGRIHTIWLGESLNLWGPPYSQSKSPFICDFEGETVFSFPQVAPWFYEAKPVRPEFGGIRTIGNAFELHYEVGGVKIVEGVKGVAKGEGWTIETTFDLREGQRDRGDFRFLAFAEGNVESELTGNLLKIKGTNGIVYMRLQPAEFRWTIETAKQKYSKEIITEAGTEKGNPILAVEGTETRAFVEIPQVKEAVSFRITLSSGLEPDVIPSQQASAARVVAGDRERRRESGDKYFRIEHFPLPPKEELIITGMDWLNERDLAVCTWLGDIYIIEGATGPVEAARYRRFAQGLSEPLGLTVAKKQIYVVQKGELTRVSDTDGNGAADWFECINDDWGYSGNYHSYSFGPLVTAENEFLVFITGQRGRADLDWQGAALHVGADRRARKVCSGLRVPHGWGNFQGDVFVTDNQGNWIGACRLNHIEEGKFYGFQLAGAKGPPRDASEVEPAVLWFPRSLAPSTSGIEVIRPDTFGPFAGQMLIGDFQNSIVMRANLEKVGGKWQGAVFPFLKGFLSGVNRLVMGADGKLYVGGGKRTWSNAAPKEFSLDRVSVTGTVPFEVKEARATKEGFELEFTKALEADPANDPENYLLKQFNYKYHEAYGSPEYDHDEKEGATETPVKEVKLSADRKTVRLAVPQLREGFVTSFRLAVNSEDDEDLRNEIFYYTLNKRPTD